MENYFLLYTANILTKDVNKYIFACISLFKKFLWLGDNEWSCVKICIYTQNDHSVIELQFNLDSNNLFSKESLKESISHFPDYVSGFVDAHCFFMDSITLKNLVISDPEIEEKLCVKYDLDYRTANENQHYGFTMLSFSKVDT